jgi:hypothetical protein
MPAISTKALSIFAAEQFVESVSEPEPFSTLYLGVGKVEAWANDASPEIPTDSVRDAYSVWKNLHFAKKITGNDMSLAVRRVDWQANTVYVPYTDQSSTLYGNNFYVLTSSFNVYKCLDNNFGANSTVEPSFTNPSIVIRTIDGYVWKYLFTVSRADRIKFMTDDWMPVRKLTLDDGSPQWDVQEAAIDGAISVIQMSNVGTGYIANTQITVSIDGDGTGASANAIRDDATNTISYVIVTVPGQNYTYGTVDIAANNSASGASANLIIPPFGGDGSDPVGELGASTVMINIRLKGNENNRLSVGNDFRQISIIRDPLLADTANVASNTIVTQLTQLDLAGFGSNYVQDEYVYQGSSLSAFTFKGIVINFDSTNNTIQLANTEGIVTAATLIGSVSAATRFVTDSILGDLEPYSGSILYIDNFVPITRDVNQTESLQIPIVF